MKQEIPFIKIIKANFQYEYFFLLCQYVSFKTNEHFWHLQLRKNLHLLSKISSTIRLRIIFRHLFWRHSWESKVPWMMDRPSRFEDLIPQHFIVEHDHKGNVKTRDEWIVCILHKRMARRIKIFTSIYGMRAENIIYYIVITVINGTMI